jgi:hypothetical protein
MDLGLSNSPTSSVETSTLGMDHAFSTSFPLSSMSHVEIIFFYIPQDNIIKIHEDLANLQNQLIDKDMSNLTIPLIYNIHHMLKDEDGIQFVYNLAQIFE